MKLLQSFTKILFEHSLIDVGDHVLVALSGGPDSVVMFDLFCRVRQELQLKVSAAHFNHGLRGIEADADEEFAKKLCRETDVECWSDKGDVQDFAKKKKMSLEHSARIMRYDFFERVADSINANAVATAHNANDQAETFLDRMIRGSGITGLEGIPLKRAKFIRPLLWTRRKDIMNYIEERNLEYRIDSSNVDTQFRRNRIRHTLLPVLRREFNPRIVSTLGRLTQIMAENEAYLLHESQKAFKQCLKFKKPDKIVLDILCILTYFKIIQKYIIILGLEELDVSRDCVHYTFLEQALNNIERRRSGKVLQVGKNCRVYVAGQELVFQLDEPEVSQKLIHVDLEKELHQLWEGLVLRTTQYTRESNSTAYQSSTSVEVVDYEKLVNPIRVRVFKQGDRFFPLNMGNSKKLSDFFIDEKVPIYKRSQIPILESNDNIVWICGYRLDDRFKITPQTKTILRLELSKKIMHKSEFEKVVHDGKFRVLISEEEIRNKVKELGQQISEDYRGKVPILIGVLNGGFIFMADLFRHMEIDCEVDFIKISSYGDALTSSGRVEILKDINADIKNRHILIVEDIVDSGLSVKFLERKFSKLDPASIKFVSLFRKRDAAKVDFQLDYQGFSIPNEFVVGYGLDHKQILRNLPAVYVMD